MQVLMTSENGFLNQMIKSPSMDLDFLIRDFPYKLN